MAEPVEKRAQRRRRSGACPICGRPRTEPYAPFCSARCARLDLARWFTGQYRIETDEAPVAEAEDG